MRWLVKEDIGVALHDKGFSKRGVGDVRAATAAVVYGCVVVPTGRVVMIRVGFSMNSK